MKGFAFHLKRARSFLSSLPPVSPKTTHWGTTPVVVRPRFGGCRRAADAGVTADARKVGEPGTGKKSTATRAKMGRRRRMEP